MQFLLSDDFFAIKKTSHGGDVFAQKDNDILFIADTPPYPRRGYGV